MTSPVLRARGLVRPHPDGSANILDDLNLDVAPGEWVAIFGPSGGGKTTLLSLAGALDVAYRGELEVLGTKPRELDDDRRAAFRNQRVGFVFQSFHLIETWTVHENVAAPLWLAGLSRADVDARVHEVLEQVGLAGRKGSGVKGMSGGERQRVAIARALVRHPALLLADEPTGNLDRDTAARVLSLFHAARERDPSLAILVATHDERTAAAADRCLELDGGVLRPREAEPSANGGRA